MRAAAAAPAPRRQWATVLGILALLATVALQPLGSAVAAEGDITTVAGGGGIGDGGAATDARLAAPQGVALDTSGNVYIADAQHHRVRRVDAATGDISTVAGTGTAGFGGDGGAAVSAHLNTPTGVALDTSDNLYIADRGNDRVRRVDAATGTITTVAGGKPGTGNVGDGGPATDARLAAPSDVHLAPDGDVYIADRDNHRIRKVEADDATISTVAGTGEAGFTGDGGSATSARLNAPSAVTLEASTGELYLADTRNHRARHVDASGTITTVAGDGTEGDGGDGGPATSASLNDPSGVAFDDSGGLLVADRDNHRIRRVDVDASIETVAGTGTAGDGGDGGSATDAELHAPVGVAVDAGGRLLIGDRDNDRVRVVDGGTISTLAGGISGYGDGGPATSANLRLPAAAVVGGDGFYIADLGHDVVRKVDGDGIITTFAGTGTGGFGGDGGPATDAQLNSPSDVAVAGDGSVYIADWGNHRVRKVTGDGVITTVAGNGTPGSSGDGGPATSASLNGPVGIDLDADGNLYIAEIDGHRIRRVSAATGEITTVAGSGAAGYSGDGGAATDAQLNSPSDVALDADVLFIADYGNHVVRRVGADGIISTYAGSGVAGYTGDGGPATDATMRGPIGVAVDAAGNLFVAEYGNHVIRKVDGTQTISTVAGNGSAGFSGDGGPAVDAQLSYPTRVDLATDGDFYIGDLGNDRIRRVETLGVPEGVVFEGTSPASPANDNEPLVHGSADAGTTVELFTDPDCSGSVVASGTAEEFASPGLAVTVPDDSETTFYGVADDGAGNRSECSSDSLTYVEDSTEPDAPSVDGPSPNPGADTSPSWSFTGAESGGSFTCRLSYGTVSGSPDTVVDDFAGCESPKSYTLDQGDGFYTFDVRHIDDAGNTSTSGSHEYELVTSDPDTIPPDAPTITAEPDPDPGNDPAVSWEFSGAEPGGSFTCELSDAGGIIDTDTACASPRGYDLPAEGTYTFSVSQVDDAGNESDTATDTHELDTSAPQAPTITSAPGPDPGNTTAVEWAFEAAEAGGTLECELAHEGVVTEPYTGCTSPAAYELADGDGTYTFSVRQLDDAGNAGAEVAESYTLDTTGPDAPTITGAPEPDPGEDTSVQWSFTGAESGGSFECRLSYEGSTVQDWAAGCSSPAAYELDQGNGTYTFEVRQIDDLGNVGDAAGDSHTLEVPPADDVPPDAPTITDSPDPDPGTATDVSWVFTGAEPGGSFECRLSLDGSVVDPYTSCTSPVSYSLDDGDGTYTFEVRQVDDAGNVGTATGESYTLDTTGPDAPSLTGPTPNPGSETEASWSFSGAEPGGSFECRLSQGSTVVDGWGACTSPAQYVLEEGDGVYTFEVRQIDDLGNTGTVAASDYTLDTVAPGSPTITDGPSSPGRFAEVSWSFTGAEAGGFFECRLTTPSATRTWETCASPASYTFTSGDGTYTFAVRQVDDAGNTGPATTASYTLDATAPGAPTITSSPSPDPGTDTSVSWSFAGAETGGSYACRLSHDGTGVSPYAACSSPASYTLTAGDGTYTFEVRHTDDAGNTSPAASSTYRLDTPDPEPETTPEPTPEPSPSPEPTPTVEPKPTPSGEPETPPTSPTPAPTAARAPAPPRMVSSPESPGSDPMPEWSFETAEGTTAECRLTRGIEILEDWHPCRDSYDVDLAAYGQGSYSLFVRAVDAGGDRSGPVRSDYTFALPSEPAAEPTAEPEPTVEPSSVPVASPEAGEGDDGVPVAAGPPAGGEGDPASVSGLTGENLMAFGATVVENSAFPAVLVLIVVAFLVVQHHIDRNDPKLAQAPVYADPDLPFTPRPTDPRTIP